jgi:hypothetical protein
MWMDGCKFCRVLDFWLRYRRQSLYALLLSTFSHIHGFISVSWGASIFCLCPAYYLHWTFSGHIRECDADDKLSITEFWHQFTIKMMIVICFLFYTFSVYAAVRRNAGPMYIESHRKRIWKWFSCSFVRTTLSHFICLSAHMFSDLIVTMYSTCC